ncbi:MAG: DUF2333 family protein [Magnetococcales bacterium]|nr:DUF2333 family protein [Magnetococcales bacterium]
MSIPVSPWRGEGRIANGRLASQLSHVWHRFAVRFGVGGVVVVIVLVALWGMAVVWSREPEPFDPRAATLERFSGDQARLVTGAVVTHTLIRVARTLLEKPGGYLTNDKTPPGVFMDNMPAWEFGVLTQTRALVQSMRNDFSRSQSQSVEDPDLARGEPQFNFNNNSWIMPATEEEYRAGLRYLDNYLVRLVDPKQTTAQFYARADNLAAWIDVVSKRLGALSQKLRSSVGQQRLNTDLGGEPDSRQSTPVAEQEFVKTPWLLIDDVFYEARGSCWALLHFLRAMEVDFQEILRKKNALVSLRQIIRELEPTQDMVWSPMVLNGGGFGLLANHSMVMGAYVSRANAALIDLRNLLQRG